MLLEANAAYRRYAAARDKAEAYRLQLMGRAVHMGGTGSGSGHGSSNSTEEGYVRLAELREDETRARLDWLAARETVEGYIGLCPVELWSQVLTYRYLNRWRFEDIARTLGYSDRQVYRMHKKAVRYLSENL